MAGSPTTPVNVRTIKEKLLRPALTSHFRCKFQPPTTLISYLNERKIAGAPNLDYVNPNVSELIELSCSDASLPGSSLNTHETNNDFTGVTERHAYRRLYDDRIDFSFYVDDNYTIIYFFDYWMSYIVGEDDLKNQLNPNYSYRVNYPNLYKANALYITKFERGRNTSGRSLNYQFINAFPISITSMPVSYESSQLLKCTVSFNYTRYILTPDILSVSEEPGQTNANGIEKNPFDLTPEEQARLNSGFAKNLNLGNLSSGTLTNTDFSSVFNNSDPTRVFQQNNLSQSTSRAFSGNLNLF
jgi:hypothetical protein